MVEIQRVPLADLGRGHRVLTPSGVLPAVEYVVWEEEGPTVVLVGLADGTAARGAADAVVHAVDEDGDVPPEALAAAPEPVWTTDIPENWTEQAWAAHLRGDGERVVALLAPLTSVAFTGNYGTWEPVEYGLALLAFELTRRGDAERAAAAVARLDVEGFQPEQEEVFRRVLRRRLREPLDGKPAPVRLREVVYRWARAAAADLDRAALRTEHATVWHEARR
jgi:uncharacterized protein DUF6707